MKIQNKIKVVWSALLVPLMMTFVLTLIIFAQNQSCTIFTIEKDGNVLFGNNEDWHSPDLLIGFFPKSAAGFGSVHVGFRHSDGSIEFGGAVNEEGLAWDINSLPSSALNPHPEKTFSHETDNYLSTITKKASTVEEAIQIAQDFDFGESMSIQVHIADATGDAVVISAGSDKEISFTRKDDRNGYLVSTNFNLANPSNGSKGWRYETATSMLSNLKSNEKLIDFAGSVLNAVHLDNLTSYTMYSNIFDLTNRQVYLYYMAQYDERAEFSIDDELSKGQRVIEMRELFSQATVDAGDSAYQRFELKFTAAKIAFISIVLILIIAIVIFVLRKVKNRQTSENQIISA